MADQIAALREWEGALRRELDALRKKQQEIAARMQHVEQKLGHVARLLELEGAASPPAPGVGEPSLEDAAATVLAEAGGPLHYSAIAERVQALGMVIPGQNPPANLLTRIHNNARFVRTGRGTYALAGQGPVAERPTRQGGKRGRRKSSATRQ